MLNVGDSVEVVSRGATNETVNLIPLSSNSSAR